MVFLRSINGVRLLDPSQFQAGTENTGRNAWLYQYKGVKLSQKLSTIGS